MKNVLSLFDGMSCGQIALNRSDLNYFASEINHRAIKITQANYPDTIQLGDVRKVDLSNLPKIDLLLAGSPCTGFSQAGKRLGFDDPQSKLYYEFLRFFQQVKPKYFLLENVRVPKEVNEKISSDLGVEPIEINSNLFVPQNRIRWYWTNLPVRELPKGQPLPVSSILEEHEGLPVKTLNRELPYKFTKNYLQWKPYKEYCHWSASYRAFYLDKPVGALTRTANNDKVLLDKENLTYRRLTVKEWERLQGVPDEYTNVEGVSKTARREALGNGWTIPVIRHLLADLVG